ncbi:hypothetical protein ACMFMF_005901 [Clarireedia jacksonii]
MPYHRARGGGGRGSRGGGNDDKLMKFSLRRTRDEILKCFTKAPSSSQTKWTEMNDARLEAEKVLNASLKAFNKAVKSQNEYEAKFLEEFGVPGGAGGAGAGGAGVVGGEEKVLE